MRSIVVLFSLFCLLTFSSRKCEAAAFVNPNIVLQENFKGWGTSLAWWADMVGGMDEEVFEYVMDAVFSPSKLNLNIARYTIGGTTPDNYVCGDYRDGAATESYRDGPDIPYNWTRDARQRRTLTAAKAKGANLLEAFSNSPPQWLTISGCSKGNNANAPLHSNFYPSNAQPFADYATEVIKHFHEELNITFSTYSPFNEPFGLHGIGSWAGSLSSQEGCNMNRPTMVSVIRSVHDEIVAKNLTFLKIAISDETQVNTQIQSYDHFTEAGVADLFGQVNVHGYWDNVEVSRKDLLSLKCVKGGHELWMDEMGWGGTPSDNMEQGLNLANRIILDLRKMLPSAWVYWQVVEGGGGWGLLQVPYEDTTVDKIVINSGYYAMEQFSQHIKQGYQLVSISDENSVAAISVPDKKLVIVSVNPTTAQVTQEFDLSLFSSLGTASLFRTSSAEQHLNLPPPTVSAGNKVTIQLPAESISTLEFSGIQFVSQDNLIKNGNFESVYNGTLIPAIWEVSGEDDAVSGENAWRGVYSGLLQIGLAKTPALRQNLVVSSNSSCVLYLSAWCLSTQPNTKLGVIVNGVQGSEIDVARNGAYSSYDLSFTVDNSDKVQIYFANNGTLISGSAKIDNVVLHADCRETNVGPTEGSNSNSGSKKYFSILMLFSVSLIAKLSCQF